ncbi:FUSC family protein [Kitasatospora sp. NPDC006697]|uniref:FUSC family protein n=1 Tax=Kitasatospora sp. NPDC006697 TaxID=3364020 RepID=UPI003697BEDB
MTSSESPWWARAVRPARPAFPGVLVARAAVGMAVPLCAGLAAGRLDLGVYAGLGAMHATLSDRTEPARRRVLRIGAAVGASALGMLVGGAVLRWGLPTAVAVLVFTAVGFVSGALSAAGPRGSAAGMLLLVSATLGAGMAPPDPWWAAGPMVLAGAAVVLLLGIPLPRTARTASDPRRRAVAEVYRALGGLLRELGTDQGPAARRRLTQQLNLLQDQLPAPRPGVREPAGTAELRRAYEGALAVTEAANGLLWARRPVPPEVAAVPAELARALEQRRTPLPCPSWEPDTPARRALGAALRSAVDAVASRPADPATAVRTAPVPPPPPWRLRVRRTAPRSLRYGARVALCTGVAELVTAGVPLTRGYWVPMTVAFVLKPDLGSVFLRAVSRAVGTVLGVALTAGVLALTTERWLLAGIVALCVALLPYAGAAHYGLNTTLMTPMALVLVQLGGGSGAAEFWPRVLDSLLASGIVLLFGYLLWPERAPHRIEPRLVAAAGSLRAYLASVSVLPADGGGPQAQVWLRRTAYRALADARTEVQHGLAEPPPAGRRAAAWLPATAALERLTGAVAAYAAQLRYGGRRSDPAEVARVLAALDRLEAAARAHRPPAGPATPPQRPHNPQRSALAQAAGELEELLTKA